MNLERNNIWAAVFQLLGALNLPPSPSALFCPASALPARGFFCTYMFMSCCGGGLRNDPIEAAEAKNFNNPPPIICVSSSVIRPLHGATFHTDPRVR
jgi:hypothetical protein